MMNIKILASGSSGNCYLIDDGITKIMIDAGIPWKKIQQKLNFQTHDIAALLLDHSHGDHSAYVDKVAKAGIDVYTAQGTIDKLKLSGHRIHAIKSQKIFAVGSWTILPFDVIHDDIEPLGFMLASTNGEKLLFLTDSAYSEYRFKGLTHIMVEANYIEEILSSNIRSGKLEPIVGHRTRRNHMALSTLIAMLKANDLTRCSAIYLLHLSNGNSSEEIMKRQVQEATGVPVHIAEEG